MTMTTWRAIGKQKVRHVESYSDWLAVWIDIGMGHDTEGGGSKVGGGEEGKEKDTKEVSEQETLVPQQS